MNATFFDNAKNHTNPAVAHAIARVRREVIAEGKAYRVDFTNAKGQAMYFDGGRYDVLALAKDIRFNGGAVAMTDPNGNAVDIAAAKF